MHDDSKITEYGKEFEEDYKSDASTKRADQIVKNIDLVNIWADMETRKDGGEVPDLEFVDHMDQEISSIDDTPHVKTITEENEPESNSYSATNSSIAKLNKVLWGQVSPDKMVIR